MMTYAPSWPRRKSAIGTLRANALGSKGRHDRSSASVSETNPTPRCSSSWSVASRSVTGSSVGSDLHVRRILIPAGGYDGIDLRIGNVKERRGYTVYVDLHSGQQRGHESLA